MTEHHWHTVRADATIAFSNELPQAQTEQAVLDHFQGHPDIVIALIQEVAEQKRAGKARSGWAILRTRLDAYAATENVRATGHNDRDAAIRQAETFIRNAGVHYPTKDEIIDHLFGHFGKLGPWPDLEPRMVALWETLHTEEAA